MPLFLAASSFADAALWQESDFFSCASMQRIEFNAHSGDDDHAFQSMATT
jgi:hypothetical protein